MAAQFIKREFELGNVHSLLLVSRVGLSSLALLAECDGVLA